MLKQIRDILMMIVNNIDCGNSNLTEEEELELLGYMREFSDRTVRLSKYQACQFLGISRATFDNYVRAGKLPEGKRQAGFKEKFWVKKDLDKFKLSIK